MQLQFDLLFGEAGNLASSVLCFVRVVSSHWRQNCRLGGRFGNSVTRVMGVRLLLPCWFFAILGFALCSGSEPQNKGKRPEMLRETRPDYELVILPVRPMNAKPMNCPVQFIL